MSYVFLDEIQNVRYYEKAVDSLYIKNNVDIYITGSNAYLLSGEYATLLSGRYIEIKMLPLSFREYLSAFNDKTDLSKKFKDYLINSSFPYALELDNYRDVRLYLDGIYNSVLLKDIVIRKNISSVASLHKVTKYLFDNIGNLCSPKSISDSMTSYGDKISVHTVDNYISGLINSFIFYKASRYDIKGKQHLKSGEKFYAADIGLRYYLLGTKKADMGRILENIVYLELLRRGCEVYVGKTGNNEVDFIAINEKGMSYYQVAWTVKEESTLKRELMPLNGISDHNPKYLITSDDDPPVSYNGIQQINSIEWLLE
jgi:predicted AAA+ superfamily ATPase